MTISTTSTWTRNRDQLITTSLRLARELNLAEQPDVDQLAAGADFLQSLLYSLHAEGVVLQMKEQYSQDITAVSTTAPYITAPSDTEEVLAGAYVRDTSDQDLPLELYDQGQYMRLSNKLLEGGPPTFYYPEKQTTDTILIYLYPIPTNGDYPTIVYPRVRRFRDTDVGSVTPDVPARWQQALEFGLAWKFALHYGRSTADTLEKRWELEKARVLGAESPNGSMSFTVDSIFPR